MDRCCGKFATGADDIDCVISTGAQTFYGNVTPPGRNGGEQLDLSIMAMEEHFGDGRSRAEIAVDLERIAGVP